MDQFGVETGFGLQQNIFNGGFDASDFKKENFDGNSQKGVTSRRKSGNEYDVAENIVACSIYMIKQGYKSKNNSNNNNLVIHGTAISAVVLRGWIIDIHILSSQIMFKISDGSSTIDVHYNISAQNEADMKVQKVKNMRKGQLICVVGAPVASKSAHEGTVSETSDNYHITIEACHFRPIHDFAEYAYYANLEIINTSLNLNANNSSPESSIADHTSQIKNENISQDEIHNQNSLDNDVDDISLPETLSHIINIIQKRILKIILKQPENKAGRISAQDIIQIIHQDCPKYSVEEIKCEIDTLLEDGDIMYTHGDFVDIV